MPIEIIQKYFHIKREAKILDTKVIYKSTIFGKEAEVSIPYEELSRDKESHFKTIPYINIIIGILSFFTFICFIYKNDKDFEDKAWLFWGTLLLVAIIIYFFTKEVLWKVRVQNNTYLFFLKNHPDKETVNDFIDSLFVSRDKYLRDTYFFEPTKYVTYESQKNNFQWLRRMEAINNEEFQKRKKELDEVFNMEVKKIGFN